VAKRFGKINVSDDDVIESEAVEGNSRHAIIPRRR
jgi:hypothetical protein